jgi:hypothetical protein
MTTDEMRRRAVAKALVMAGAADVRPVRYGLYLVGSASRPGAVVHTVTGTREDGADLKCTCEAGLSGKPCWHAASVWLAKMEHNFGVRVTEVASRPSPPAASNVVAFRRRAA